MKAEQKKQKNLYIFQYIFPPVLLPVLSAKCKGQFNGDASVKQSPLPLKKNRRKYFLDEKPWQGQKLWLSLMNWKNNPQNTKQAKVEPTKSNLKLKELRRRKKKQTFFFFKQKTKFFDWQKIENTVKCIYISNCYKCFKI